MVPEGDGSITHLISDFVIELLEMLEVPEERINELAAKLELVRTLDGKPEDMMVYMCSVGQHLIQSKDDSSDVLISLDPTETQIQKQAIRMTQSYLAMLNC